VSAAGAATGELWRLGVLPLLRLIRSKEASPVEVVRAFLDRIDAVNDDLNAVVTLRRADALREAGDAEHLVAGGGAQALTGLPFTVKDTIETAGVRTTAGSKLRAGVVPGRDAPIVSRMRSEGAILLGKTNTPEFAMTYSTDNDLFGRTRNPLDRDLTAGGSSGGEAAIIAAGGSPLGWGSDFGGSVRVPAAFCGIAGLRPTEGRLPSQGHVPTLPPPFEAMSLVGPLSRSAADLETVMAAVDPSWHTFSTGIRGLRVGFMVEDGVVPVAAEVMRAVREAAGSLEVDRPVEEVQIPCLPELYALWDELWEASGGVRGLLRGYITDESAVSRPLRKLLDASPGTPDSRRLEKAERKLEELRTTVDRFMEGLDVILCPVAAGPPGERAGSWTIRKIEIRGSRGFGYSYVWSLLGYPAVAVAFPPAARPVTAVQVVAKRGQDEVALAVARAMGG